MRGVLRFTWLLVTVGCIYLGYVFYSRASDNRALVRRLEESRTAQDRAVVQAYGEGRLTILSFYATPGIIRRGQKTQLCYGVSNSKSVRIEPPVENVWPSFGRCVEVQPRKDTTYTLIAEAADKSTKTVSITVKVH